MFYKHKKRGLFLQKHVKNATLPDNFVVHQSNTKSVNMAHFALTMPTSYFLRPKSRQKVRLLRPSKHGLRKILSLFWTNSPKNRRNKPNSPPNRAGPSGPVNRVGSNMVCLPRFLPSARPVCPKQRDFSKACPSSKARMDG
jgi:hypothetical protein